MVEAGIKPGLIVIAGPNGSGKTSVTQKFLHHEWADGTVYINPDQIANDKFGERNSREAVLEAANYCADGSMARLHYQHTYSRKTGEVHTATTENRPDIVLTVVKPDGFELTYLFDAKYRLRDDNKLNREAREE